MPKNKKESKPEAGNAEENAGNADSSNKDDYEGGGAVERSFDASGDIFDDVFGEDEEKKSARKKMAEKAKELEEKAKKRTGAGGTKGAEAAEGAGMEYDTGKEAGEPEPELFPTFEVKGGNEKPVGGGKEVMEGSDGDIYKNSGEEKQAKSEGNSEEENSEGKKSGKSETDSEEDSEEDEREKDEELNERLGRKKKKSKIVGGASIDSVLGPEAKESSEEEAEAKGKKIERHPIEKTIIKNVIKNKAKKVINPEDGAPLKEEGVKEEGIKEKEAEDEEKKKKSKIKPELSLLMSEEGNAFIGRKKSVLKKHGEEAGLLVGRVEEDQEEMHHTKVMLDGLNPHVVFACGARGTGKSYVLGVLAEELALKNHNVGVVVVDPIGVFWSMKHPNKEQKELELLADWELMPQGLNNIKSFIPVGMKGSVPQSTYDATFSIQPAMLTAEDWCLTFGIDRFSPTGLLMEKGIHKVKQGYTNLEGKQIRGKENTFSLDDLVKCYQTDAELNNREKGYKADSIRALVSRFDAAKGWGIFDEKGTPLSVLSRSGQMTILDTSFLEENVGALVVGIISRRLLQARKLSTRREAAGKFSETNMEDIVELNVPPTWLFIDEAHTLIPGGNQRTPASNALVEYVKQGRRPGCSLVFATQQPSAIDPKVLSQLDVILAHKLVFDDDIKSIQKRTPAIIPAPYKKTSFVKTLPMGVALTGDRQDTTARAFVMNIRPRMSQHEGRDAETTEVSQNLDGEQVGQLATNIVLKQLEKDPAISLHSIEQTIDSLNHTYGQKIEMGSVLEDLKKKNVAVGEEYVSIPGQELEEELTEELGEEMDSGEEGTREEGESGEKEEGEDYEESVELVALKPVIGEAGARKALAKKRLKKKLGLFGEEEILDRISMKYATIYHIKYNYFSQKDAFRVGEAYIDSLTGEFIHDVNGKLKESRGMAKISELNEAEAKAFKLLKGKKTLGEVTKELGMEKGNAKRVLDSLISKGLAREAKQKERSIYFSKEKIDLPPTPLNDMLPSIGKRPITEIDSAAAIQPKVSEKEIPPMLKKIWGNVVVKEINELYMPLWEGVLKKKTGEERIERIDAINGNSIVPSKKK